MEKIQLESMKISRIADEVHKVVIGQESALEFIIIAVLCNGHILLEGVPGTAKTTMIKAITQALGLSFKRIQFTPDLMPSDLLGTFIYNSRSQEFEIKKGPVFANLILADEINRAPAKVQSALLECMQEHQVTIGSDTFKLEDPFIVFATQNPIEQEGVYVLPEAQLDRFMFKLIVDYPTPEQEKIIISSKLDINDIKQVISRQDLFESRKLIEQVYVDEKIYDYIVKIVYATRKPELCGLSNIKEYLEYGVSTRATIALYQASRAYAFLKKRDFVIPDDIKSVALAVMRHRLSLTYEAEAAGITVDSLLKQILATIPTP